MQVALFSTCSWNKILQIVLSQTEAVGANSDEGISEILKYNLSFLLFSFQLSFILPTNLLYFFWGKESQILYDYTFLLCHLNITCLPTSFDIPSQAFWTQKAPFFPPQNYTWLKNQKGF